MARTPGSVFAVSCLAWLRSLNISDVIWQLSAANISGFLFLKSCCAWGLEGMLPDRAADWHAYSTSRVRTVQSLLCYVGTAVLIFQHQLLGARCLHLCCSPRRL